MKEINFNELHREIMWKLNTDLNTECLLFWNWPYPYGLFELHTALQNLLSSLDRSQPGQSHVLLHYECTACFKTHTSECFFTFLGLMFLSLALIIVAQGNFIHFLLLDTISPSEALWVVWTWNEYQSRMNHSWQMKGCYSRRLFHLQLTCLRLVLLRFPFIVISHGDFVHLLPLRAILAPKSLWVI